MSSNLPKDAAQRKAIPLCSGVLDYFPAALAEVAKVSKAGNDQHNPGQPLHWSRDKSSDHADCITRHLSERGTLDTDLMRHSAKLAWRALALLQIELEEAGAPMARGASIDITPDNPFEHPVVKVLRKLRKEYPELLHPIPPSPSEAAVMGTPRAYTREQFMADHENMDEPEPKAHEYAVRAKDLGDLNYGGTD